jgi:hypothetical protein
MPLDSLEVLCLNLGWPTFLFSSTEDSTSAKGFGVLSRTFTVVRHPLNESVGVISC